MIPDTDDAARIEATEPGESVVLQAPAGSGKTSVLTQRLLRLLATVDEPEEILAITFTRRAAAEMRERVLRALKGEVGSGTLAERLRGLAAAALERSRQRGWRLEDDPGRLRIQTIDSFNLRLAQRLPLAGRTGGALEISTRPEEQYRLAARQTLLAAEEEPLFAADIDLWFERLDNRWSNVERMLADMLKVRAHWLTHLWGSEPEALGRRVAQSLQRLVADRLEEACARLGALRHEAGQLAGLGTLGAQIETLAAWKTLAHLTLTDKGEWRRKPDKRLGEAAATAQGRAALTALIERLASIPAAREMLLELAALPVPALSETDGAALEALSRLLRLAAGQLELQFALDGRVDHTCIAGAARAALTAEGQPTDLALRAGLKLRHILVDEFQDTSTAQTHLLSALTAAWEPGDGRTLFVVGDPMQSIYGFREAEVGCFLKLRDRGIGAIRLRPLALTRNFRSAPALIDWFNSQFSQLFPAADELRDSAVRFTPSIAGRKRTEQGETELRLFPVGDRAAETDAVVERIRALKANDPSAAIAVLVAARAHAKRIVAQLAACGLEAIGVNLVPLRDVPLVCDLVSLTRALHHLGDRTAWLAVLRAPWCGASLASLTQLSRRNDARLVFESLRDPQLLAECPLTERPNLERVGAVLAGALDQRDRLPLADWLEQTWLALGAADAYPASELPHARAFFDAVSERAAALEWRGADSLEPVLAGLFARPRATGGRPVQILTIHHAKGLEFDHVLIPGLDRRLNRGTEPLLRWLDLPRPAGDESDLLLAPAAAIGESAPGEIGPYVKRLQERRAANEQVRLLYVAATRARRSLHLYASLDPKADGTYRPVAGTPLHALWPALGPAFVASVAAAPAADNDPQIALGANRLRRLKADWRPPEWPAPSTPVQLPLGRQSLEPPEFSWVQETARHVGTVVHAALQAFAGEPHLPDPQSLAARTDFYREQLRRQGVPVQALEPALSRVLAALRRTVTEERGRWILAREHPEAHSELALTGLFAGRLTNVVIDRCLVDQAGTRWVIDFKTSLHEGGGLEAFLEAEAQRYRGQLQVYAGLARGLGPQPVKAGLYFPLLGVFREIALD